jgi:glucosamine--fructose-6-phosphate aminotransferase (isomerizing)
MIVIHSGLESQVFSAGSIISTDISRTFNNENNILIFISRTGESSETVQAEKMLKKSDFHCLGVTCQRDSSIIKNSNESYLFDYAYEESVVMTGSFAVILNFLLAQTENNYLFNKSERILKQSEVAIDKIELEKINHFVFLGFNELFVLAKEGSLKLQEMALESVGYFEPLEYRHGPKSTLTDTTLVLIQIQGTKYENDLVNELREYNAKAIVVGPNGDVDINKNEKNNIPLRIIPVLLLGYKKAISKGLNPDSPKNLSKTVMI